MQASRDARALVAATYADNRPGLEWRALQDTTNDPVVARRQPKPYRGYQMSEDYYSGGQMMWLEADARIRKLSGGRKSLDDFARAFFGIRSEEHTSELQSLMRISYAVFCLKKQILTAIQPS